MPSIDKILESESQNNGSFIRLYPEGAFYKAYERSAWLACVYLGRLLVKKRFVKKVNLNVTSVGFPKSSLEKWGDGARMPTNDEINELLQFCSWEKRSRNNINGYNLIGPNENHIFLPMEGYIFPGVDSPVYGYYWSGTRKSRINSYGLYFDWEYGYYGIEEWECLVGAAIRPVKDKEIKN